MIIPISEIQNWRDLEDQVYLFFQEMEYEVEAQKKLRLVRGHKAIDVYVKDPLASLNQIYLIECKMWEKNIDGDVVLAFRSVMHDAGANTGFIISKNGFIASAHEAAMYTNIQLLTFEELQHKYGDEWYRKKQEKLLNNLKQIKFHYHNHFNQLNPATGINNLVFDTPELIQRLYYFNKWMSDLSIIIESNLNGSYNNTTPIKVPSNPDKPETQSDEYFEFSTLREYFEVTERAALRCIKEFETLLKNAKSKYGTLSESDQLKLMDQSISEIKKEAPIRTLENKLSIEDYKKIIDIL